MDIGIASLAGSVGSAYAAYRGQKQTEKFNAREAAKQRDFSERMSRHAYRYAVEDLERAGLNPMLAYTQGGAHVPTGASASTGGSGYAAAASHTARALEKSFAIKNIQAQNRLIDAQENNQSAQAFYYDQLRKKTGAEARSAQIEADWQEEMGNLMRNVKFGANTAGAVQQALEVLKMMMRKK